MSPVFIDFEATSLFGGSYPLEIGCAWITDDVAVSIADLIRPDPGWPEDWSAESAAVHGIRREDLANAEPAASVARRYASLLAGRVVVSDAPEFDERWLGRLLKLLPDQPRIRLIDLDHLVHVAMSHEAQRAVYEYLAVSSAPHRAGDDAARLAGAWLAGLRAARG